MLVLCGIKCLLYRQQQQSSYHKRMRYILHKHNQPKNRNSTVLSTNLCCLQNICYFLLLSSLLVIESIWWEFLVFLSNYQVLYVLLYLYWSYVDFEICLIFLGERLSHEYNMEYSMVYVQLAVSFTHGILYPRRCEGFSHYISSDFS